MLIATTDRLHIRHFHLEDAAFLLELLNSPGWLRYIGDRGVRTLGDAQNYLQSRMLDHYRRWGYGMYLVAQRGSGRALGACGLVNRTGLEGVDLGFALLPEFEGQGYAREAAEAVVQDAWWRVELPRLLAITLPENHRSVRLLEQLGFETAGQIVMEGDALLLMQIERPRTRS
ncbi:MAG: GNAT family N-acetyltransferase [Bacteroidota bacterium]